MEEEEEGEAPYLMSASVCSWSVCLSVVGVGFRYLLGERSAIGIVVLNLRLIDSQSREEGVVCTQHNMVKSLSVNLTTRID